MQRSLIKTAVLCGLLITTSFAASDSTDQFAKQFDFSDALMPKSIFLGFIGPEYRKLNIEFLKVTKDASDAFSYSVQGRSSVGNNKCKFSGIIRIRDIREFSKMHYGVDNEYKDAGIKSQGELRGDYEFNEEQNKTFCGVYKGTMSLTWYVDKSGKIRYDDIEMSYADTFKNNQYEGTWCAHTNKKMKIANWGEYRIPNSGDLDVGAGEFGANPKYFKQGWQK